MRETCSQNEINYVFIGFVLSMLHWSLCLVYFACLLVFLNQGIYGCIKGLLILTARGILSTGVSASFNSIVSYEKFALIFIFSLYILMNTGKEWIPAAISSVKGMIMFFMVYCIFTAFFTSSYPLVSAFKAISYAIPCCAVITGVSCTDEEMDWMSYIYDLFTPIMLLSIALLPIPGRSRIVNASFQGAINHPNLYGIVASLYIGIALYTMIRRPEKSTTMRMILIVAVFYTLYLCESRTGMFSAVIILGIFMVTQRGPARNRLLLFFVLMIVAAVGMSFANPSRFGNISETITQFIYKREGAGLWDSRTELFNVSEIKYQANKMFGSGFCTPYVNGLKDYQFSFSLTYEAGNIWYAVLGDCGIMGAMIFWGYVLFMGVNTPKNRWILFLYPIILSMGEMAFFATNNIAIIYYVFFGICLSGENEFSQINEIEEGI